MYLHFTVIGNKFGINIYLQSKYVLLRGSRSYLCKFFCHCSV